MLKIWLTWLQPSLGVLGVAMLLSSPLASSAVTKPTGVAATKLPKQQSLAKPAPSAIASTAGTTIDRELKSIAIPLTPDMAVRQLAIGTMANSDSSAPKISARAPQKFTNNNSNALASFLNPTEGLQNLATAKPQFVKHTVAAATATRSLQAKSSVIVPGLTIGNSDVHLSSRFLPSGRTERPSLTAKLIASPTLTTGILASTPVASPYPVVLPQQMKGLRLTPEIASLPKMQISVAQSNDVVGSIPSGLQRLLGNEPIRQPIASIAPIAKAASPKIDTTVALSQLVSPETSTPTLTARGASLQLNTSQVYASLPKFDLPGAAISNPVSNRQFQAAKPSTSIFAVKSVQRDLTTAVTQRKRDYVALMTDRFLITSPKPVWTTVSQSHNLGGLILGSPVPASTNSVAFLSMAKPAPTSKALALFAPASMN
jgi:hypothetical protein